MAIQSFTLNPLSDNQVVDAVNNATNTISRASSVTAAARPIATNEVTATEIAAGVVSSTELASTAAKDNLDALADTSRGYIKTNPVATEFKVIALQRDASGQLDIEYDDVAV